MLLQISGLRLAICALMAVGTLPNAVRADDVEWSDSKEKKEGSTRTKGSGKAVTKSDGTMVVSVDVDVRKSGISGVGKGSMSVILYDNEGKAFMSIPVGRTVGAVASGSASKSDSREITLRKSVQEKVGAFELQPDCDDDKGYPTSVPDLIKKIGDVDKNLKDAGLPSFKDLQPGKVYDFKGGSITRRKK